VLPPGPELLFVTQSVGVSKLLLQIVAPDFEYVFIDFPTTGLISILLKLELGNSNKF